MSHKNKSLVYLIAFIFICVFVVVFKMCGDDAKAITLSSPAWKAVSDTLMPNKVTDTILTGIKRIVGDGADMVTLGNDTVNIGDKGANENVIIMLYDNSDSGGIRLNATDNDMEFLNSAGAWTNIGAGGGEANTISDSGTYDETTGFGLAGGKTSTAVKVKGLIEGANIAIAKVGDSGLSITSSGSADGQDADSIMGVDISVQAPADEDVLIYSTDSTMYYPAPIDSANISDNSISEPDLRITNSPGSGEDEWALTWEWTGSNMTWQLQDDIPESGDLGIIDTEGEFESELFAIVVPAEVPGLETNAAVDSEAELEAILGIAFGTKTATDDNILVGDGTDFESVAMSGDATINNGVVALAVNSVDSDEYTDGSIDNEHLADNAVDSDELAAGSVDAAHLAADVVDESKIADNGIDSEHYNDQSIDSVHVADAVHNLYAKDNGDTLTGSFLIENTETTTSLTVRNADSSAVRIRALQGTVSSADILFDAADGDFANHNYAQIKHARTDTTEGALTFILSDSFYTNSKFIWKLPRTQPAGQTNVMTLGADSVYFSVDLVMADTNTLHIPAAANPTTAAEGEIAWDADDEAIEVYSGDESESVLIPIYYTIEKTLFQPDLVNAEDDSIGIFRADALRCPHGIEIDEVSIELGADAAYTMVLQVWNEADPPVYENVISSVVTIGTESYAEEAPDTDVVVEADHRIYLAVPDTDVPWVKVKIIYHITEGD